VIDIRSWPKKLNDAPWRQIARLPENSSSSRTWPLLGMLALGLVAGAALGGYAVSQRSQMKRLAMYGHRLSDELAGIGKDEADKPVAVATSHRSNHRRKAASEV
jgi:hypothetical protein